MPEDTEEKEGWVTVSSTVRTCIGEAVKDIARERGVTPSALISEFINERVEYYVQGSEASYGLFSVNGILFDAQTPEMQNILSEALSGYTAQSGI